jgi:hypothetical protein
MGFSFSYPVIGGNGCVDAAGSAVRASVIAHRPSRMLSNW